MKMDARAHGPAHAVGINNIKRDGLLLALFSWCVVCYTASRNGDHGGNVIFVSAFSLSLPKSALNSIHYNSATARRTSSLSYKDRDDDDVGQEGNDEDDTLISKADVKDGTVGRVINDSLTNVIYYNDLDGGADEIVASTNSDTGNHKLNGPINVTPPTIVNDNSSQSQPMYMSSFQLIKKVPKGEPMSMSTFYFRGSLDDNDMEKNPGCSSTTSSSSSSNDHDSSNNEPGPSSSTNNPANARKESKIESWKTKMSRNRPFSVSNYLESLNANTNATMGEDGANTNNKNNNKRKTGDDDDDNQNLLRSLRNQQAQIRSSKTQDMQQAMYNAMRRTNPKEAIARRMAKAQEESKKKEREKLERLYLERKKRLDAKIKNEKLYMEERERQKKLLEHRAGQRIEEALTSKEDARDSAGSNKGESSANVKRGIPILDILSRPPVIDAPPLLVGSTLTYQYSDLTPFQKRAVDVAISLHDEHCARMAVDEGASTNKNDDSSTIPMPQAGDEGGIQAAPIIAVIDSYTASLPLQQQGQLHKIANARYATLASIEIIKGGTSSSSSDNGDTPTGIRLTGVGRAFLHDYFSSKHAGSTEDEVELSKLLTNIQELERDHMYANDENDIASDQDMEADDVDLPVVMAEFDIFLDDCSFRSPDQSSRDVVSESRSSSIHAITELYRTANKVYRLHEERKKLVAGLRAGMARLRHGKKKLATDVNCSLEFEDCDNLGNIGEEFYETATEWEEISTARSQSEDSIPMRSRLEAMENYGLGSYGILSTIPDLTKQSMLQLESYYSPVHRQREEYEAEVASMVIFRTLEMYATPDEVASALMASSAIQRIELGYEVMMRHRNELNDLVVMMSKDLVDCGEECTDLW